LIFIPAWIEVNAASQHRIVLNAHEIQCGRSTSENWKSYARNTPSHFSSPIKKKRKLSQRYALNTRRNLSDSKNNGASTTPLLKLNKYDALNPCGAEFLSQRL